MTLGMDNVGTSYVAINDNWRLLKRSMKLRLIEVVKRKELDFDLKIWAYDSRTLDLLTMISNILPESLSCTVHRNSLAINVLLICQAAQRQRMCSIAH